MMANNGGLVPSESWVEIFMGRTNVGMHNVVLVFEFICWIDGVWRVKNGLRLEIMVVFVFCR